MQMPEVAETLDTSGSSCPLPILKTKKAEFMQNTQDTIRRFLTPPGKIAVIGASSNVDKPGYFVPKYLQEMGFTIIPINPYHQDLFDEKTYNSLQDLKAEIKELKGVIIYRRKEIAEIEGLNAIALGISLVWLPEGITSANLINLSKFHDVEVVQDSCPMKEAEKLLSIKVRLR